MDSPRKTRLSKARRTSENIFGILSAITFTFDKCRWKSLSLAFTYTFLGIIQLLKYHIFTGTFGLENAKKIIPGYTKSGKTIKFCLELQTYIQ